MTKTCESCEHARVTVKNKAGKCLNYAVTGAAHVAKVHCRLNKLTQKYVSVEEFLVSRECAAGCEKHSSVDDNEQTDNSQGSS